MEFSKRQYPGFRVHEKKRGRSVKQHLLLRQRLGGSYAFNICVFFTVLGSIDTVFYGQNCHIDGNTALLRTRMSTCFTFPRFMQIIGR
jgi:hypothetical protein